MKRLKEEIDKYFDYYKIFSIMYSNAQSLNGVYSFIICEPCV